MAMKKISLALLLLSIIAFSFIALIQLEKNNPPKLTSSFPQNPAVLISHPVFADVVKAQPLITNTTRMEVYDFIVQNPGVQFRGICSSLGIAIGTAEFHLGVLKKAGLISFIRDGRYKRFFASKKYSAEKMVLISLLRHDTIREIVKKILVDKTVSHGRLASFLGITSQGLTWQINRLRETEIVQEHVSVTKVRYSIYEQYLEILPELINIVEI